MLTDVRKSIRTRCLPLLAITLMARPLIGQFPKELQVVDITPNPDATTAGEAARAYDEGNIIRVLNATEADVIPLFGVTLGTFKAFQASGKALSPDTARSKPLKLRAVAGYKDGRGVVHIVQSFAPDDSADVKKSRWREHLDDWIRQEQAKAAQTTVEDPQPPEQAWTTLYETTIQATTNYQNFLQDTFGVYRLISTDQQNDYYMVFAAPEAKPDFDSCNGYDYCGWHTHDRNFSIQPPQVILADHGPQGTQSGESASFNIGGQLSGEGPGVNASFTANWSQPDVTTTDTSNNTTASWQEAFHFNTIPCNPAFGNVPPESSNTFFSYQGAIYQVPAGTNTFNPTATATANFCRYTSFIGPGGGFLFDTASFVFSLQLGPPQLYASPQNLMVPAGQSEPILVSSFIPDSPQGFAWQITSNQSWLSVPSN